VIERERGMRWGGGVRVSIMVMGWFEEVLWAGVVDLHRCLHRRKV
jgi:hypothetical protein